MELERSKDPRNDADNWLLRFTSSEREIVSCAFLEEINERFERGNVSSVSDMEIFMTGFPKISSPETPYPAISLKLSDPRFILSAVRKFHYDTERKIEDIISRSTKPPFSNFDAIKRRDLGKSAGKLYEEMEQLYKSQIDKDPPIQEVVQAPTAEDIELMHREIQKLLGGEETNP